MKYYFTLLLSLFYCLGSFAQTASEGLVKASIIADGLFFDKSTPANSIIPDGSTMAVLKDPENEMVIAVYLPDGYVMDESTIALAIPAERVMHAEQLLRDYNGRRPQKSVMPDGIGVRVGEPMVKFEYSDTENNIWNNEILNGKVYVINIWQRECGPCRREMPVLSQWRERFPEAVFLSASRHNTEEILPIVEQHRFSWTHLKEATDLVALVGKQGFPLTIVVDKNGIVRFAKTGASEENQSEAVAAIDGLTN